MLFNDIYLVVGMLFLSYITLGGLYMFDRYYDYFFPIIEDPVDIEKRVTGEATTRKNKISIVDDDTDEFDDDDDADYVDATFIQSYGKKSQNSYSNSSSGSSNNNGNRGSSSRSSSNSSRNSSNSSRNSNGSKGSNSSRNSNSNNGSNGNSNTPLLVQSSAKYVNNQTPFLMQLTQRLADIDKPEQTYMVPSASSSIQSSETAIEPHYDVPRSTRIVSQISTYEPQQLPSLPPYSPLPPPLPSFSQYPIPQPPFPPPPPLPV